MAAQEAHEEWRAGQTIQVIKVKPRTGIKGSVEATLAHDACETSNCHRSVYNCLPIRDHIHWPM